MKTTKSILQEELKKLNDKYYMVDEGLDWLRLGLNSCSYYEAIKQKYNTTTGPAIYNIPGRDVVIRTKGKQGENLNFIRNFVFNGFTIPVNMLAITKTNKKQKIGYPYMINFYGLFFQLGRLSKIDINGEINHIIRGEIAKITRADYNWNFNFKTKKEIENYIKSLATRYINEKNKGLINNETFYLRYKQSKGRIDGKVVNGETKRLGLKRYDKSKDIIDLGLGLIYQQYEGQAILRFEAFLGNAIFKDYYWSSSEELIRFIKNKLIGREAIIESQNKQKKQFKTNEYLKRTKKTVESYLATYLKNGGELEDLIIEGYPIFEFIERKQEIDEILFEKK